MWCDAPPARPLGNVGAGTLSILADFISYQHTNDIQSSRCGNDIHFSQNVSAVLLGAALYQIMGGYVAPSRALTPRQAPRYAAPTCPAASCPLMAHRSAATNTGVDDAKCTPALAPPSALSCYRRRCGKKTLYHQ